MNGMFIRKVEYVELLFLPTYTSISLNNGRAARGERINYSKNVQR